MPDDELAEPFPGIREQLETYLEINRDDVARAMNLIWLYFIDDAFHIMYYACKLTLFAIYLLQVIMHAPSSAFV